MCLGSRCVLCDFSNTLGLAEAKTHSVKFLFPFIFLSPCVFSRNVVHLILIHFPITQQKSCLRIARKYPSSKSSLFHGSLLRIFLSNPPHPASPVWPSPYKTKHFLCCLCTSSVSLGWPSLWPFPLPLDSFSPWQNCKYGHPPLTHSLLPTVNSCPKTLKL